MEKETTAIQLDNVYKNFKVYADRAFTLKERALFWKRGNHSVHHILNGLNLTIKKGEVVGMIGQNGCGKSTTLKLMTRILYPEKGTISVNGRVSSLLELGAGFHPDLSGRDNIYANAAIFGLSKKETNARLNSIIQFSELEEYIDNPVRTYSSGMYMRLAFAVAINVDAEILLIDEILAVGDANFQSKCYHRMNELKQKGVTIVLVTHDMGTVEKFCNRAIWLNKGKIMADGAPVDVVDQYRSYMNEKQIERIQREENAEAQEPQERETDSNHFGTGDVKIVDAFLRNAQNERTKILRGGESATIEIHYEVEKPCSGYMFGMGFYTSEQQLVYGNNTDLDGIKLTEIKGKGVVKFHIEKLPLLSGDYGLNVAVVDESQRPLDFYRCYTMIQVVSDDRSVGFASVDHQWDVSGT